MKRTFIFLIGLALLGFLAYEIAYLSYVSSHEKQSILESENSAEDPEQEKSKETEDFYYVKLEAEHLKIYKMPEQHLYDSVKVTSFPPDVSKEELIKGKRINTLTEVFEFLENFMS